MPKIAMKKRNCWEVIKCGREAVDDDCFFSEDGSCPASTALYLDGINDGKNAGRACWAVAGTFCGDEVQGDQASKLKSCLVCEFYRQVRREEGDHFITGSELIEMVQYQDQIFQSKLEHRKEKSMKIKKSILIERLVEEMGSFMAEEIGRKARTEIARETVNLFFDSIREALQAGERVEIRGFGSFSVKNYDGYTGRNPRTGARIEVQPKKLPVFRPGAALKNLVDGKQDAAADAAVRRKLVAQIRNVDDQIQAYVEDTTGKSPVELERMSGAELQELLNLRTTRLQTMIDQGIMETQNNCSTKA